MTKLSRTVVCVFFLLAFFAESKAQSLAAPAIIPQPTSLTHGKGAFVVLPTTSIFPSPNTPFQSEAALLAELFVNPFGKALRQTSQAGGKQIKFQLDETLKGEEAYRISVDANAIVLFAKKPVGMFRAVQTMRQLLSVGIERKESKSTLLIPAVEISDAPSYDWRGVHLDVSRHFFSIDYLRRQVDLMALYKLNKFHLHLTDDQGWRIEIKKYPKLTKEGAWRSFNNQDSVCMKLAKENPDFVIDPKHIITKNGRQLYGGFYTQKELKELVAYAAKRHVEIIPEIDMPGHMMAAINAYNYLSCEGTVSSFGELFSTPVCPCKPEVIAFAQGIFKEVMDIFPSQYIHIGGDEVDRSHWEKSDACKALMQKEGLKTSAELQAWFIRQMESFFNANGKKLIGWDEILEGGVSNTAAIMYWRTWVPTAPVEAAKNGNRVIMTPGAPMYFSEPPDKNSLPAVYQYNIIPKGLSDSERANIIGTQANLWSEYVPTEQRADYLYMPRLTALAEVAWSDKRNYAAYLQRLNIHYQRLDLLNVRYRLPDLDVLNRYAFTDSLRFQPAIPLPGMRIHYTLDGSLPTTKSAEVKTALTIRQSQTVRLAAFKNGRRGDVYDVAFDKQAWATASNVTGLKEGLQVDWYKRSFKNTTLITGSPDGTTTTGQIAAPEQTKAESFTLRFKGYINVPEQGIYTFYLTSDDASFLRIAGKTVVDNDGMHAPLEKNGQIALQKGAHQFALDFIEGGGGYTLKLLYSLNGSIPAEIPAGWFKQ